MVRCAWILALTLTAALVAASGCQDTPDNDNAVDRTGAASRRKPVVPARTSFANADAQAAAEDDQDAAAAASDAGKRDAGPARDVRSSMDAAQAMDSGFDASSGTTPDAQQTDIEPCQPFVMPSDC